MQPTIIQSSKYCNNKLHQERVPLASPKTVGAQPPQPNDQLMHKCERAAACAPQCAPHTNAQSTRHTPSQINARAPCTSAPSTHNTHTIHTHQHSPSHYSTQAIFEPAQDETRGALQEGGTPCSSPLSQRCVFYISVLCFTTCVRKPLIPKLPTLPMQNIYAEAFLRLSRPLMSVTQLLAAWKAFSA